VAEAVAAVTAAVAAAAVAAMIAVVVAPVTATAAVSAGTTEMGTRAVVKARVTGEKRSVTITRAFPVVLRVVMMQTECIAM